MTKVLEVQGYGTRLQAASEYVRSCRELYANALAARNALIVEAVDHGYAGHQAARDCQVAQPHIIRILSTSQPDLLIEAAQH
jgi:hypothetical protein